MLQCVSGQHVRSLAGLRVTGFERRVTIAFIVTADAVLIEGIFYGGGTSRRSFAIARESTKIFFGETLPCRDSHAAYQRWEACPTRFISRVAYDFLGYC